MITLIVLTSIFIILLIFSIKFNWENTIIGSVLVLLTIGLLGWGAIGSSMTFDTKYKLVSKENFEIFIGKDDIILNENVSGNVETFSDAKTYNVVKGGVDNYYIEETRYNLYNKIIGTSHIIRDTILEPEIIEQIYELKNTY